MPVEVLYDILGLLASSDLKNFIYFTRNISLESTQRRPDNGGRTDGRTPRAKDIRFNMHTAKQRIAVLLIRNSTESSFCKLLCVQVLFLASHANRPYRAPSSRWDSVSCMGPAAAAAAAPVGGLGVEVHVTVAHWRVTTRSRGTLQSCWRIAPLCVRAWLFVPQVSQVL